MQHRNTAIQTLRDIELWSTGSYKNSDTIIFYVEAPWLTIDSRRSQPSSFKRCVYPLRPLLSYQATNQLRKWQTIMGATEVELRALDANNNPIEGMRHQVSNTVGVNLSIGPRIAVPQIATVEIDGLEVKTEGYEVTLVDP